MKITECKFPLQETLPSLHLICQGGVLAMMCIHFLEEDPQNHMSFKPHKTGTDPCRCGDWLASCLLD